MRVGQATLHQEVSHQWRLVWRVLHHDPVELGNVEEGLGQTSQLGLLHQPGQGQSEIRVYVRKRDGGEEGE